MTIRERFFNLLEGKPIDRALFFPDISSWYQAARLGLGKKQIFLPGEYIPDDADIHKKQGTLSAEFSKLTLRDFYRKYDWGFPVHIYDWFEEKYTENVEKCIEIENNHKKVTWKTPMGKLERNYVIDAEGNWAETGHMVKKLEDLKILKFIIENTDYIPKHNKIERFLNENKENGVCDVVLYRSPFGKIVHEYMGFESVVYSLYDNKNKILDFLEFQEYHDMKLLKLAAETPARIVIISDHADENLISPPMYREYCIPYYRKACDLLHSHGKYVSTHLDGNIRGYLSFIKETGFDILDGCTPSPMFNYEVEELAQATNGSIVCYCGVPASFFTTGTEVETICNFGRRILNAFKGRVIINIGDILPPLGDIRAVMELGKYLNSIDISQYQL